LIAEQKHVETTVKAAFAEISVVLSFHDEDQNLCDPEGDLVNVHWLAAECRDIALLLQVIIVLAEL
jgi:autophagy-related protein 2